MKKTLLNNFFLKNYFKRKTVSIQLLILFFFLSFNVNGQTTLISPTGDGGFETGSTFAANGWSATSLSAAPFNSWICGTGATSGFSGTRCAYVTQNGTNHSYAATTSNVSHLYKSITVPSGENNISLNFNVICNGEGTSILYDYLRVWKIPTGITPIVGTPIVASSSNVLIGEMNSLTSWTAKNYILPSSLAGTSFQLVFEWINDSSTRNNPPAGIDNVSLVSQAIVAPPNATCATATNLPCATSNLAGTTVGTTGSSANGTACSMSDYGVWYKFVGDGQQTTISATTTSFDIEMAISSGSCGSFTNLLVKILLYQVVQKHTLLRQQTELITMYILHIMAQAEPPQELLQFQELVQQHLFHHQMLLVLRQQVYLVLLPI